MARPIHSRVGSSATAYAGDRGDNEKPARQRLALSCGSCLQVALAYILIASQTKYKCAPGKKKKLFENGALDLSNDRTCRLALSGHPNFFLTYTF